MRLCLVKSHSGSGHENEVRVKHYAKGLLRENHPALLCRVERFDCMALGHVNLRPKTDTQQNSMYYMYFGKRWLSTNVNMTCTFIEFTRNIFNNLKI
jgi:hypothetical protein